MIDNVFPVAISGFLVLVPAAVGIAVIVTSLRRWIRVQQLAANGVPATAVVVDNQQKSLGSDGVRFMPVVTFPTATGQQVRAVLEEHASHTSHLAGTEYPIVYDPADPRRAVVPGRRIGSLIAALVVGLVFLVFAVIAYQFTRAMLDDPFGMAPAVLPPAGLGGL